ncbi:ECF transporter S component [Paeniglutamicibacter kerguelensis]|uniref:Energy-coupling factor transport system substrate-specific component n=1 Tax=Paeniglutamicibacter kerguelensis TaxID=254788 RepID=A0ABS4XDU8_9MICC|nr:ECF transporter S component [Paeniglutamicibacter kerguelensis]MBP2386568.1 energy-coupling factor transport system substrate-specific component [Paeniglutamicibacter kerguelensis]
MSPNLTLPETATGSPLRRRLLAATGALLLAGTYTTLVLTQPAGLTDGLGASVALATFAAYLAAAVLLLAAVLPELPVSTLTLIPVALALNIVLGQFVGSVMVPLYLDSLGTVLVGFLAGRRAGAATGVLGTLIWSLFNPTVLPFAAGAALVGFLAGTAARFGALRRPYLAPVAGLAVGVLVGVVSAPVAAFVFGGTSGVGTGAVVAAFRSMGDSLLSAVTKQALISDPGDKAIVFLLAALLIYALPGRLTASFAFVRRHRVLGSRTSR